MTRLNPVLPPEMAKTRIRAYSFHIIRSIVLLRRRTTPPTDRHAKRNCMRTLVLNAGYEPLAVVSFRRALVLVLSGKASVVAESGDPVVGPTEILPRPSVILLHRYVKIPYREGTAATRRGVLRRDGHQCAYCGKAASTVDHVLPKSRGGADSWENMVACCLRCNNAKGDRTLNQLGWQLRFRPQPPRGARWQIRELERPAPQWNEFLDAGTAA